MRLRVDRLGAVEWAVIGAVLVLIIAEAVAFQNGLGPFIGVVALGYLLALIAAYLLYRYHRSTESSITGLASTLQTVDIFRDLTDTERETVASFGERVRIPAGQARGTASEPGSCLYIVLDGKAELSAPSAIGQITVRIAGPGESFPLATLLGSGSLITTVTAMTDMELLAIPRFDLLSLWQGNPTLGMRMYATIADILGNRYRSTLAHLTTSAEQALRAADFWANV